MKSSSLSALDSMDDGPPGSSFVPGKLIQKTQNVISTNTFDNAPAENPPTTSFEEHSIRVELAHHEPRIISHFVSHITSTSASSVRGIPPTTVCVTTSVREAAGLIRENDTTAVLVQDQCNMTWS